MEQFEKQQSVIPKQDKVPKIAGELYEWLIKFQSSGLKRLNLYLRVNLV